MLKRFFIAVNLAVLFLTIAFGFNNLAWAGSWTNPGVWIHGNSYSILCAAASPDGKIWAAGQSGKVSYHNGNTWVDPGSWPAGTNNIYSMTVGTDGTIWFGGMDGRVASWNGSWQDRGTVSSGRNIRAAVTGKDGTIYVADESGFVYKWNGSSWTSLGQWPAGNAIIYAMTVGLDGSIWAGGVSGNVAVWNGSSWISKSWTGGPVIYAMTTAYDGSIWVGGGSGRTGRYNGISWEDKGYWQNSAYYLYGLASAPDGAIWAVGDSFYTARHNGSSWVDMGNPMGIYGSGYIFWGLTVKTDGTIWALGRNGAVQSYNSSLSAFSVTGVSQNSVNFSYGYDGGGLIGAKIQRSTDNINFTDVLTVSGTSAVDTSASPGTTYYYRLMWGVFGKQIGNSQSISALTIPATPGSPTVIASGSVGYNITWTGVTGATAYEIWRDGSYLKDVAGTSTTDSGLGINTQHNYRIKSKNTSGASPLSTGTTKYTLANPPTAGAYSGFSQTGLTVNINANGNPAGTQYQFQLKNSGGTVIQGPTAWGTATSATFSGLSSGTNYSVEAKAINGDGIATGWVNLGTTVTIPGAPTVTSLVNGLSWSNAAGRGYVTASWPAVTGASGYKWYVYDGNAWRSFDLGNVTSLDSRTLRIYPDEPTIASWSNNAYLNDPFNHSQGGLDLRDDPRGLYAKTPGTTWDSDAKYHMSVVAYNASGQSAIQQGSSGFWPVLPNRTDTSQPSSSLLDINGGAANTGARAVTLSITASDPVVSNYTSDTSDDYSGLLKVQISNDNFASYQEYNWPTQGQQSGSATFIWSLIAGDGSKIVYIRPVDRAGNIGPIRTASIYLVNDVDAPTVTLKINGGPSGGTTTTQYINLNIEATDNLSAPDQLTMRYSVNGGTTWTSWGTYGPTVSNVDLGTTGGLRTICVQVKDANGNIANATTTVYYAKVGDANSTPSDSTAAPTTSNAIGENLNGTVVTINSNPTMILQTDAVTLSLTNINTSAGPVQFYTSFDGVNWSPANQIPNGSSTFSKTVTFPREGTLALSYKLKNGYGAESPVYTRYYSIDHTPPVISEAKTLNGAQATSGSTVQLSLRATDNISTTLYYSINGGGYAQLPADGVVTSPTLSSGLNSLRIKVIDRAGNIATAVVNVWKL